jgi:23S rRNA (adenine2503-C2)-methyltransferase
MNLRFPDKRVFDVQGPSYDLTGFSLPELQRIAEQLGEKTYRARQIFRWLYQKKVTSIDEMTDLSLAFRQKLSAGGYYVGALKMLQEQISARDDTRKYLFELADGNTIESVLLAEDSRNTLCFSTQAGCAMGCAFCATGQSGFARNLRTGEIIGQALGVMRRVTGRRLTNAVAMGQGEPLANYDETIKALRILNSPDGFAIGARHLTLSTCGLVEGIRRLSKEPEQFGLAVSLHSAIDAKRAQLMPKAAKTSLAVLKAACVEYTNITGRRVTLEYTLIAGENDDDVDLHALIQFCRGWLCHVNLIPLNPVATLKYDRSAPGRVMKFGKELEQAGIAVSIRREKGADLDAACGQLRQRQVHRP